MASINKSFNFRHGVQVDDDDFTVRGGLVGIGTTVPTERLVPSPLPPSYTAEHIFSRIIFQRLRKKH